MSETRHLTFTPLAESTLLVQIGDSPTIEPEIVASVWALTAALDQLAMVGVEDIVPANSTILICFDPAQTDAGAIEQHVRETTSNLPTDAAAPSRTIEIPVVYGGDAGPDLADVAAHANLSPDEVIARHSGGSYRVACGGFAPGWDYLMGLPPALATPRLTNPRTRIPIGSVAIGGMQSGVYPLETPGGWRLIGRTPLRMFDPKRPDPFLLHPGDGVTFRSIDKETYASIEKDLTEESYVSPGTSGIGFLRSQREATTTTGAQATIRVVEPGMLTTVQDLGRPGMARFGVAPGGVLDRTALILGNRLLGNDPGEAGLEITLLGPRLVFTDSAAIALTGADLGARLNNGVLPRWGAVHLNPGDEISFDPSLGTGNAARAYLCVAGGIDLDPVLGSRSTDLVGHFGGLDGRPLQAGDTIPLRFSAIEADAVGGLTLTDSPPSYDSAFTARVTFGPQADRFTDEGRAAFLTSEYTVSTKANRQGIRLSGPAIAHTSNADLISEGIAHGAIQVPGDGQPIVLLAARQTVGGYVKIATVIGADLDRFAQLRPGAKVRFAEVSPDEARSATLHAREKIGPEAVRKISRSHLGWSPAISQQDLEGLTDVSFRGVWDPAGVVQVIEAAQKAGVWSLHLEIVELGLKLDLQRGGGETSTLQPPQERREANTPQQATDPSNVITAPVLGVFYRRSSPDVPPLAEEGATVEAGQTIALLEVMKTYHEVQASEAGTLIEFLVEDGQFVEYGQPIARFNPASHSSDEAPQ